MRDGAPQEVIANVAGRRSTASSWLGGEVLAETIPIIGGRLTGSIHQQVPETLTLTIPRYGDGKDWYPGNDPRHPLARYGQELVVETLTTAPRSGIEYETPLGRYLIQRWDRMADGSIMVTAVGRLQRALTDTLTSPMAPRPGGTLASEFRRLLPAGFTASIDPALTDRACPQSLEWPDSRIDALYSIADAWPARLRTDQWGQISLLPPLPEIPKPTLTLKHGEGGTIVRLLDKDTRDQGYNRVVARSSAIDDPEQPPIQAVVTQTAGPMAANPSGYGIVTKTWSSPLLATTAQAQKAGQTMLANELRRTKIFQVTMVPDPRVDFDDAVAVVDKTGTTYWGYVLAYDVPVTVKDGPMRIDVGVAQ